MNNYNYNNNFDPYSNFPDQNNQNKRFSNDNKAQIVGPSNDIPIMNEIMELIRYVVFIAVISLN